MKKDYVVLNLEKEYPGYTGTEKWMIVTDLAEDEFRLLYPTEYRFWKKAVIVSPAIGAEIIRFKNNEKKYESRAKRSECSVEEEGMNVADNKVEDEFSNLWLKDALHRLPQVQRTRVVKHFIAGYSEEMIASQENVARIVVHKSILRGIANLRKYCGISSMDLEVR